MRFINIVPVFPENVDFMIGEAKRIHHETGLTEFLLCMPLHRQGSSRLAKVKLFRHILRKYMNQLAGTEIKVGVLFQALLGHWDDAVLPPASCMAVNSQKSTTIRRCILDPDFLQYITDVVEMIATEHPYCVMVDDDCRQINNDKVECFCSRHMHRFNEYSSRHFTDDELIAHLKTCSSDDQALKLFEKLRIESMIIFAQRIRKAIDRTDSSIPCIVCTPGNEFTTIGCMAKTYAGENNPIIRLCNANYCEGDAKWFPDNLYRSAALKNLIHGIKCIDEADTWPHNRYSKAASSFHAKLIWACLNGETGAKLWITNFVEPDCQAGERYEQVMAKYLKYYNELEKLVSGAKKTGLVTPLPRKENVLRQFHPFHPEQSFYHGEWQAVQLSHYGIPAQYNRIGTHGVQLLSGDMVKFFDDRDLKWLLAQKIIVDGTAAKELIRRQFGPYIGVVQKAASRVVNKEIILNSGHCLGCAILKGDPVFTALAGAEILTELRHFPFDGSPDSTVIGHGVTLYHNKLGGTVVTCCRPAASMLSPAGRRMLLEILGRLNDGPLEVVVDTDQNILTRTFRLQDDTTLLAVTNLNFDPLEKVMLATANPLKKITILNIDGTRQPISWLCRGNNTELDYRLNVYETAILFLKETVCKNKNERRRLKTKK